ncbi:hypothetical protein [Haloactinopolyspora alba]|nr:hypothetical protein [Haloactinopolyspora alba]
MSDEQSTSAPPTPRKPRRWVWPLAAFLLFFVGVGIGTSGDTGGTGDAAAVDDLRGQLEEVTSERDSLAESADAGESDLAEREAALETRAGELDEREAALDERAGQLDQRETAITESEEAVAANTVSDGYWIVGTDMEPGTYRAVGVSSDCYWGIYTSGTNGSDILGNGLPGGGNPQVTVEEGQDFESQRCGEWTKQ